MSHQVSPLMKLVARGDTTVVDAYLSPVLRRYVDQVAAQLPGVQLQFMQSSGGLADAQPVSRQGRDSLRPRGWHRRRGRAPRSRRAFDKIISFDMGGTSTDVAHYAGEYERAFDTEVAGVRLRAPIMQIHTVAAGGGSICQFDGVRLRVGPRVRRRGSGTGGVSSRRPDHGHRLQRAARADSAGLLSRGVRRGRRFAAGCAASLQIEFRALAADIERATGVAADAARASRPAASGSRSRTWRTPSRRFPCSAVTT